jgi:hypothetical protein
MNDAMRGLSLQAHFFPIMSIGRSAITIEDMPLAGVLGLTICSAHFLGEGWHICAELARVSLNHSAGESISMGRPN